jgi:two-component system, OmpR family, phosphate regulon sensor histidine kinase PhoR
MFKGLPILMIVAITAITGFQVFWLKENYTKEKKNLEFKSNVVFKETVRRLQSKKLNLDKVFTDSTGNIRIELFDDRPLPIGHPAELTNILNDVTIRVTDSLNSKVFVNKPKTIIRRAKRSADSFELRPKRSNMIISMDESFSHDSTRSIQFERKAPPGEIVRFLYSVDSLQDSLKIKEIDSACRIAFRKEGLNIPITISRDDSSFTKERRIPLDQPPAFNKVTIGFARPVTYELKLGNTFVYIVKKMASPILFSLFLVGVTVLAFVLLYRNFQRQKKLTNIKNEFISNITHELKTPIATVGVAIEALRNFNALNDPQRTKEYLDISQNELHRLSLLVDKVLKLSMFEKKEIELKYEPLDLKELVNEVVSSMRLQIEKHNAIVSINVKGDTTIRGDKLHLLSVVFNLLDNALKYGNGHLPGAIGQGNIVVKFDLEEKGGNVVLTVADNGIGIAPEYREKVFEKFFRVPGGNTHNTKGYGLGLSYVAHVIQKHKGQITVESQQGLGAEFIITLPKTA